RAAAGGRPCAAPSADRRPAARAAPRPGGKGPARWGRRRGFSKRKLEAGGEAQARRHAAHLLRDRGLDLVRGVVEGGGDEVLEHLALVAHERGVDRDALYLVFAGHLHLDHACARLAFDLHRGEALLHAAHVLLHLLRLLHQLSDIAFHGLPPSLPFARSFSRSEESTSFASNMLTRSCTKPSPCADFTASARFASRSPASSAAALAPATSPTDTLTRTAAPRCWSSAAFSFSTYARSARYAFALGT